MLQQKITILFISHDSSLYGAQKSLLDFLVNIDVDKYLPIVIGSKLGPFTEVLDRKAIKFFCVPFEWWVGAGVFFKTLKRLVLNLFCLYIYQRRLANISIDIVYSNTSVVPFGALLAFVLKKPHVWHAREFVEEDLGLKFDFGTKFSRKLMAFSSGKIIVNSNSLKGEFEKNVDKSKLVTIYNGVLDLWDLDMNFNGKKIQNKNRIKIGIVGRIVKYKGQEDAIRAVKTIMLRSCILPTLYIVGNGSKQEIDRLKKLSSELGVSSQINYLGHHDNINEVFHTFDITYVCSICEAFGRVVVESMATGTPVIGSIAGGIPEIIRDGENGMLYFPGDVDMLAYKTINMVKSSEDYQRISKVAYFDVFRRFNNQRYQKEICEVIDSCLGF